MAGRFLIKKNDARTGTCNTGDVVYQFDAIGFEFGYSTDNVVNFYANVQRDSRRVYRSTLRYRCRLCSVRESPGKSCLLGTLR